MEQKIAELKAVLPESISQAENLIVLDEIRVKSLGKNGTVTGLMKELGKLNPDERKTAGQVLNVFKNEISSLIDARKVELEEK